MSVDTLVVAAPGAPGTIVGDPGSREAAVSVNATANGDTAVLATPGAGNFRRIFRVYIGNNGTTLTVARLQEAGSAVDIVAAPVAANGGGVIIDFGPFGHDITVNTGLDVNLPAAGTRDVFVNVLEHAIRT